MENDGLNTEGLANPGLDRGREYTGPDSIRHAWEVLQEGLRSRDNDISRLVEELIAQRRALQESERRWRAVFENSSVGIGLTDVDGRVLAANGALQRMLGYSEEEFRSIWLMDITLEDDREQSRALVAQLLKGERREYHLQKRYQQRNGKVVWANVNVSLVPATDTEPQMLLRIVEDISERKKTEQALAQAQADLARVARITSLGELAASIAHEVKQPLAAVVTNAHACLRWLGAKPINLREGRDAVQRIIRDANLASEVVSRIRAFLHRRETHKTTLHIDDVVLEALALVQAEARRRDVSVQFQAATGIPSIFADGVELQQVIVNLVMNAIEAVTPVEGRPRSVEISADCNGPDSLLVSVRDTGVGLDPQHRERIFEPFYTTKPEGMGMGLAISRSIVETHGGRLWVTPNEGPGETFHFTIPFGTPGES
ncbi:MAG: PAS domain S-box protein [Betaproteobacteria bacterium]|nr:PAS domain S-box protein [Betaproteobacteria bacterium]